jgi:hypothetical protein
MKKSVLLMGFLLVTFFANAQAVRDWTSGLPTLYNYNNHTIATDSQGNVYSVGIYSGSAFDFDPSPGVFNMSSFSQSMYILKLDASGNFVWAKEIGGPTNYAITSATSITIDSSDNIYVSGSTNSIIAGNIDFDPGTGVSNVANPSGHYVMYILKLDSNGNHIWDKQFNNPANTSYDLDTVQSMKVDASGNVYATGGYNGTVDFDPGSGVYNLTSVVTGFGSTDIFIMKLDSFGNLVWAKALQNNSTATGGKLDKGFAIDVDTSGNVYSVGYFWGGIDADPGTGTYNLVGYTSSNPVIAAGNVLYVSKLDSSGNFVWAYNLVGDHNTQFLPSLAVDHSNNIIVSGYITGETSTLTDFDFGAGTAYISSTSGPFVLKMDASANFIWVKSTASITTAVNAQSYSTGLALDATGNIYTTGGFYAGTYDFDPNAATFLMTPVGAVDAYVSKLDTNGNFVWATKLGDTGNEWGYSLAVSPLGKVIFSGSTSTGFSKLSSGAITGGFLASYTQPALTTSLFNLNKNISVYPNPSFGTFNIEIDENLIGAKATIYNLLGQKVKDFSLNATNTTQNLNHGNYLVEIEKDGNITTKKLIVN